MEKFKLTCWRYKTDDEYNNDVAQAKYEAERKGEDPNKVKVRQTKDIDCWAETYYMLPNKQGKRMVNIRMHRGREYHIMASDLAGVLRELDFEVNDLRLRRQ